MRVAGALAGWAAAGALGATWLLGRRALGARMELVARACHELRGPITAARLGLELGLRGAALSRAQLCAIDSELCCASLALADLTAARGGRLAPPELAPLDLRAVLTCSVQAWRPSASAAGVQLGLRWTGVPVTVSGDRVRLAQAIGNLIANAIEHGGGRVEVHGCGHVSGAGRSAGARIEVADDGPGLPAPVAQLTDRAGRGRGRGARGRGLAIAAGIVAAHGGRLAGAPSDRGARLVLELPVAATGAVPRARVR